MAEKLLVDHLIRSEDITQRKGNILSFLSSQPDHKRIDCDFFESLRILVAHLLDFLTNAGPTITGSTALAANEQWIVKVLNTILTETCIPVLLMPRPTAYDGNKKEKLKIFELSYDIVSTIVCSGPLEHAQCIWRLVFKSLQSFVDEYKIGFDVGHELDGSDESLLPVATALDLLACLLDNVNTWKDCRVEFTHEGNSEMEETVLCAVLNVLSVVENESILFKVTGRILPRLLSINEETLYRNTKSIWESVKVSRLKEQEDKQHSSGFLTSYAIMSSVADLYFKESSKTVFQICYDPVFWSMIQAGLVNIDSLVRKRSLYLLQKVIEMCKDQGQVEKMYLEETWPVFWWNPDSAEEILNIWQQYVFFLETLEEKQLHVIQPVLSRIEELINATKKTKNACFPLLHVSWLSVIVHRAAIHENRFIKKWGIMILLTLDFNEVPLLENVVTRNFTCDTFIMLLKEPTLYAKNHGEAKAEPSELTKQLLRFFKKCSEALHEEEKTAFFTQVFIAIPRYNISHVPLTFISQSLSNVPRFAMLGCDLLSSLRSIIANMYSHSVMLRGAVKIFLLRTFMNFVKPASVSVHEVLVFLGSFAKVESLCRGTKIWDEVKTWLSESHNLFQKETKNLFTCLDSYVRSFLKDEYSDKTREVALQLSKFVLLCYDCSAITKDDINQLFDIIFVTIRKAQSNVYHPVSSCWQAVELLYGFFHELLGAGQERTIVDDAVISFLISVYDVLDCITQTLVRTVGQEDEYCGFHGYNAYFNMLEEVKSLWLTCKFPDDVHRRVQTVLNKHADLGISLWNNKAQCTTVKLWLLFLISLKINIWVIDVTDSTDFVFSKNRKNKFLRCVWSLALTSNLHFPNEGKCRNGSYLKEESWRIVAQDIISTKWHCINIAVKHSESKDNSESYCSHTLARSSYSDIVETCVEAMSLTSGSASYSCLETLRLCLPELIRAGDEDTTILLLESAWSMLNELRTRYSGDFWLALDIVVKIIFSSELLRLSAGCTVDSYVRKYWMSILSIADDQSGLVSVTVAHLCKVFSSMYRSQSFEVSSVNYHADIIADICMFGPVHKKDQRLFVDTAAYVSCLGEEAGVLSLTKYKECECEWARVHVDLLAFLLNVDYSHHICSLFVVELIRVLLERSQVLSEIKASRFLNSENHRKKQRLWQIILILVSQITDEKFVLEFSNTILKALEGDNQTSVRFLMEWSLVRLFSGRIHLLETVWKQMKSLYKTRLGYVASLVSIVTHVFLTLEEPEPQIEYLQQLMPAIIPCAFLNHSQVRAYILAALQLISTTCPKDVWSQISQQFPLVRSCLQFTQSVVEGEKERNRLQKDRDLFFLHPVKDFSIEVIFQTVPVITGVVDDEVISPSEFQSQGSEEWTEINDLPLCRRALMCESQESTGKATQPELCATKSGHGKIATSNSSSVAVDVQKKITPWNVIAPPQEDQDNSNKVRQRPIERRVGDLIVVASLIDRAPNLGGLCRTCEVFGASRLVLGSKHVVSEKDFKSVSVSSEKWVDLEDVKIHDLGKYLLRMKKEGFTIVGVEQTAQSKKLTDFHFPRSTVLVLGNEKAGIPVDVIQLLDECVEIPQQGIIRSLNVHVSGALFIWEYCRQHLNDK